MKIYLSVDEIIFQYYGHTTLKEFINYKPISFGYKLQAMKCTVKTLHCTMKKNQIFQNASNFLYIQFWILYVQLLFKTFMYNLLSTSFTRRFPGLSKKRTNFEKALKVAKFF